MKKVALSACLLGCNCRYDGADNLNTSLLKLLEKYELVPFCPEEHCFGTPRPTMDLLDNGETIEAISNETTQNISQPIFEYAKDFFDQNVDIELFIGKDRSPSCAVKSAKVYDVHKNLLHINGTGLMAQVAKERAIKCWDAEDYLNKDNHRGIVSTTF
jgi:uncharacterized protein YbbK (DUF523 family)